MVLQDGLAVMVEKMQVIEEVDMVEDLIQVVVVHIIRNKEEKRRLWFIII